MKSYLNKPHLLDSSVLTCAGLDGRHVIFSDYLYATEARDRLLISHSGRFYLKNEEKKKPSVRNEKNVYSSLQLAQRGSALLSFSTRVTRLIYLTHSLTVLTRKSPGNRFSRPNLQQVNSSAKKQNDTHDESCPNLIYIKSTLS